MAVVNFSSISFSNIKAEIERYLRSEHGKANILYSPASPYGQTENRVEITATCIKSRKGLFNAQ